MPKRKRSADELIVEVEDYVLEYLVVRKQEQGIVDPLISEIRAFLNRVSGRPTSMTDFVVRRLERKGMITVTRMADDGTVTLTKKEEKNVEQVADTAGDALRRRMRHPRKD